MASLFAIIFASIDLPEIAERALIGIAFLLYVNGVSLILVTITIRLLRVYRIFILTERQKIGKYWKNGPLILIVLLVSLTPNLVIVFFSISLVTSYISLGLIGAYIWLYLFIILFLAIRTRKIKYEDFKETKTITYFIITMIIIVTLGTSVVIILSVAGNGTASYGVVASMLLMIPLACQLCFFTPKLIRIVFEKFLPGVRLPTFLFTTTQPTMTSLHATENT